MFNILTSFTGETSNFIDDKIILTVAIGRVPVILHVDELIVYVKKSYPNIDRRQSQSSGTNIYAISLRYTTGTVGFVV